MSVTYRNDRQVELLPKESLERKARRALASIDGALALPTAEERARALEALTRSADDFLELNALRHGMMLRLAELAG
jgi:hypothetical protein